MIRSVARDPATAGVIAIWLIVCAVLLGMEWRSVLAGTPADSDDYMRLLEVRDWLGGQSWWDVTQYRMNPPVGGLMHWSRLVDLPIAAGLVALTPLLGPRAAEAATVTIVPLAILGLVMAAMAQVARRLFAAPAAPAVAAMLIAATGFIGVQMYPARIDHHGWQILLAAVALAAFLDPRPRRSGAVAGLALAAWLDISIEGLPFAVAAAGAAALRWLLAPDEEGPRFAAFTAALAAGSALLFAATHAPGSWTTRWCDAITPAHLLALAGGGAGSALLVRFAGHRPTAVRIAGLAVVGAGCACVFLAVAPGCAANPFGALDPLVHDAWYLNVLEGLPIWRQPRMVGVNLVFFPAVGVVGSALAWRAAPDAAARRDWLTIAVLLAGSVALMILLRRAAGVAHLMAVPGALAVIEPLRARVGRFASPVARALGAVAAVCVPSPLMPIYANALLRADAPTPAPASVEEPCAIRRRLAPLGSLAPATILTTIDDGAPVIALTRHKVLAGPYHRNDRALADLIRAFTGDAATAHAIVRRHGIGYVLVDPRSSEAEIYAERAPAGMMAGLRRGRAPAWLDPLPTGTCGMRLWHVVG